MECRQIDARTGMHLVVTIGLCITVHEILSQADEPGRGREWDALERSIDVQISRLRRLIEPDPSKPRYIQTVWGVGYVFVPDGAGNR
ncbi:hypothetical protein GS393_05565 [Pseudomonas savastanoi pv. phaseolicola]|nr:hypothetical protein [Pseudomonas savastanoi pv. phaseolicola]